MSQVFSRFRMLPDRYTRLLRLLVNLGVLWDLIDWLRNWHGLLLALLVIDDIGTLARAHLEHLLVNKFEAGLLARKE